MSTIDLTRRWLSFALAAGAATVSRASGSDTVDVWIELTEAPPSAAMPASAARRQRDRLNSQQQRVADALSRLGAVELGRIRVNGNAIAVRIDRMRLDAVRAIDGVKRVRPARSLHPPQTGGRPQG